MRSALLCDSAASRQKFPANGFPEIIRGKHKLRILWGLQYGPSRFGEIRRRLSSGAANRKPVASRVLSRELRSLVDLGLVNRKAYNEIPLKVEYRLTTLGRSLLPVIEKIVDWGTKHSSCLRVAKGPSLSQWPKEIRGRSHQSQDDKKSLTKRQTASQRVYHDYVKGRFHLAQATEESIRRAIGYFERVIEKDPSHALGFAGLSDAYILLAFFSLVAPSEVLPQSKQAALKALEIDEGLAEAHTSLAGIMKVYDWDWRGAEREYRRALELNRNYPHTHRSYADLLSAVGRHQEALQENRKAQELDPISCAIRMQGAWTLYMAREYKAAQQQAHKTLQMEPNFAPAHFVLALTYERMGRPKEAIAAFEKTRSLSGDNPATIAGLGHTLGIAGHKAEPRGLLKELQVISNRRYVSPCCFALVHAGLGELERAFMWLEEAVVTRDVWLVWLKAEPRFDRLRSAPRFQDLLGRVGLR